MFFGAGVLGSLYAARLHEAGTEVTLVARGSRYEDLKKHGIVLEQFNTGERTTTNVRLVDSIPENEYFDVCVVLIQKNQLHDALPALATNPHIPAFLFMHNDSEGPQPMIDALGRERVLLGHVNAGGERDGYVVRYMVAEKMTMGELNGEKSQRLQQIAGAFKAAGFPVVFSRNMDSWKRYHVAIGLALTGSIYMAGLCNYRLARNRAAIRKCWQGMREAFQVLRTLGFPMEPPKLRWGMHIPEFIMVPLLQRVLGSELFDIGGVRHARNARDEMLQLREEFRQLKEKAGIKTPVLDEVEKYFDPSVPPAFTD
ncbi:ketopantoate reductase family protein [Candidatus Contubernalis alkaliaceticus]|uniref:ketopantoate reductase family protein n=1 Tax=Candidatus Contubernalis alkaliaceticus TaxID=338645 RepID=UPI001F4C4EEE|nr:2-dehydropantoate 2-reductase N-terminal domain-containing protein [Candidatus Contubernalis alkalaceticus]UNC91160.1 ketopantoate reductase family protein [Candidatus Contubernalis alkalaceticus]